MSSKPINAQACAAKTADGRKRAANVRARGERIVSTLGQAYKMFRANDRPKALPVSDDAIAEFRRRKEEEMRNASLGTVTLGMCGTLADRTVEVDQFEEGGAVTLPLPPEEEK